ncbi:MAG: hypothetical protein SV422_08485 [Pseudomonadota bacterium]|nr:hypothetical protein [Pseudomonadota bacterium]
MNAKNDLAEIDAKILKLSILSLPGPLLTALALLGKYGEPGEIPFDFLNDSTLTTAMLVIGVAILTGTFFFIIKLGVAKAKAQMAQERGNQQR